MKKSKIKKIIFISIIVICCVIITVISVSCAFSNVVKKASKGLSNYTINATLSNEYVINANQTIEYKNTTGKEINDICLHLYARAFREDANIKPYTNLNKASCFPNGISYGDIEVSKVNLNGESANFEFVGEDQDILRINLYEALKNKKSVTIYLEYLVRLPNSTHRMGYYNGTINLGNWYPIVCAFNAEGWDTSPYYSTGDPFYSECANYNVSISYPSEYNCYASGEVITSSSGNSSYKALAVRDFAMVLSNKDVNVSKKAGDTTVTYVGYEGDTDIDTNIQIATKAVEYFSEQFGEYPYKNLTVVKSAFLQGGMEYPNIVIVSDAITEAEEYQKVIVHEIAHQWWYGLVGNDQIGEAWLDESLAEYSTCLFFEDNSNFGQNYSDIIKDAIASYQIYVDVISSLSGKVNTAMNLAVNKYVSEYEYTYMIYVKGVIMFDSLREVVGKDKLIKALKKYAKEYRFKIATGENLVAMLKKHCHKDLDNFFSGWLNGSNVVGYVD